jgi:SAM-dependent methyltransferase
MGRTLEAGLGARFSHVGNFTGYMRRVYELLAAEPARLRILDVPAGNGLLADALAEAGHSVVPADINGERRDFAYANLEERLPFEDGAFDVTICLEGIEHLVNQTECLRELVRVTKSGGRVVISTPNVQNFFSRLTFLFRGVFYQFSPATLKQVEAGERADRGHVAPVGVFELSYLMAAFGAKLERTLGDHVKKKALLPVFGLLLPLMALATYPMLRGVPRFLMVDGKRPARLFMNRYALLSRSLICVFRKV